ncbi:hypothetical protein [Psychromonas aquimarina]|uniref:hypothetical protein n=1 Tax=Psychromonas aquimarina TaxID=444919 RepID=UPI00041659D2|nr:hypothetical protein [Psychromonas aquimarina]
MNFSLFRNKPSLFVGAGLLIIFVVLSAPFLIGTSCSMDFHGERERFDFKMKCENGIAYTAIETDKGSFFFGKAVFGRLGDNIYLLMLDREVHISSDDESRFIKQYFLRKTLNHLRLLDINGSQVICSMENAVNQCITEKKIEL